MYLFRCRLLQPTVFDRSSISEARVMQLQVLLIYCDAILAALPLFELGPVTGHIRLIENDLEDGRSGSHNADTHVVS